MKNRIKVTAILLSVLLFVGCGKADENVGGTSGSSIVQQPNSEIAENQQMMYSNLVGDSARTEVSQILEKHGVSKEQTDTLMLWADDFNARVTAGALQEGFGPMNKTGADYQGLVIKNNEAEDGWIYPEANCRLTSFLLMKNMIETNGKHEDGDTVLMFDLEAIDTYEPFKLSKEEREQFASLFNWVPLNGADTLGKHIEQIQNVWKERAIKIQADGISLITVYLHSPFDDVRFVGHTGVLAETEEGLLFVEKYGPQYPFQATKFENRKELTEYLLNRADLYGDETELAPIIMENDRVIA